jgi:hypothetical protein
LPQKMSDDEYERSIKIKQREERKNIRKIPLLL